MPSEAKVAAVEQLKQVLEGASSIYLTDFTGMPVEMMSDLRRKCREADVEYRVVKDSLTKLAAEQAGVKEVIEFLEGPVALALGHSDQLAPARVLSEFAKVNKLPRMKAALVEGRIFIEDEVKTLAVMPSRDALLAQFAAGVISPLRGFTGILNQMMWKMVATIEAVGKTKEAQGTIDVAAGKTLEKPEEAVKAEADSSEAKAQEDSSGAAAAGKEEVGEGGAETAAAEPGPKEDGTEAGGESDKRGDD